MAEYEPVRQAVLSAFKPEMSGDPPGDSGRDLEGG